MKRCNNITGKFKMNLPERLFKLRENNTSVRKEIYAGIITFLAVAYILAVNPDILSSTGMPRGGLFYVTAIAAFIGTLAMAFVANAPLALAPAMGLNAFFAYSVVQTLGFSWQFALFAIVVEGVIFFFLSLSSIREKIINAIPLSLKYAMGAGVGLYITLIAFKNAHIKANLFQFYAVCILCGHQTDHNEYGTDHKRKHRCKSNTKNFPMENNHEQQI
jgi:AGZA family xanthine/uracil permease-like MFS transporter